MLFKWVWRFLCNPSGYWVQIVKRLYGPDGGIFSTFSSSRNSIWTDILKAVHLLKNKGVDLLCWCKRQVRDGLDTSFWFDRWHEDGILKDKFPRVFLLDNAPADTIRAKMDVRRWELTLRREPRGGREEEQWLGLKSCLESFQFRDGADFWSWGLDVLGVFSVASVRSFIDDNLLGCSEVATRWNKLVPIKVNVFCWRLSLNRLPTRINLDRRGVDIPSVMCALCSSGLESTDHIFFRCPIACSLSRLVCRWWGISIMTSKSFGEWCHWLRDVKIGSLQKTFLEGVFFSMWWLIWNFRNHRLFGRNEQKLSELFDKVVTLSFLWCGSRFKKYKINWVGWLSNPLLVIL